MFRRTDQQLPLLGAEQVLPTGARQRLTSSWAEGFRTRVMPELLASEERFRLLYAGEGRPNWSVARLLAVCLLQHQSGLSDQEALDALSFDVRWQYALSLGPDDAYLSRRSLVEFRRRLVQCDPEGSLVREVFERICKAGIQELGLSTSEQRLDSTLIASNIRLQGRLGVARETLRLFVRSLSESERGKLPDAIQRWYDGLEGQGWNHDGSAKEAPQRLREIGHWVTQALAAFADDSSVTDSEPYHLLQRLVAEHGEALGLAPPAPAVQEVAAPVSEQDDDEPPGDASGNAAPSPAVNRAGRAAGHRKQKRKIRRGKQRAHYWSAHDPDASFGHKGCGYHVHVSETCRNERAELITDYSVVTAACSDVGQASPALDRLERAGLTPQTLYVDAGYPTPAELISIPKKGVAFIAPVHRGPLPKSTFSRTEFTFDADSGLVTHCPAGHPPTRHAERESSDTAHPRRSLHAFFAVDKCRACPAKKGCPVRQPNNAYSKDYRLDIAPELMARDARWTEQQSPSFRKRYRIRSGVEATMSELKRGHRLEKLRVRRMPRVVLQVAFKTTACNVKRWLRALLALWAALSCLLAAFGVRAVENPSH